MSLFGKTVPNPKHKWPNCEPPTEGVVSCTNINGHQYHRVEVSPGHWQWQINEEAERRFEASESHKMGLFYLLTARVMTSDELRQAAAYGSHLNILANVTYYHDEKARELQIAWTIQQTLQAAKVAAP